MNEQDIKRGLRGVMTVRVLEELLEHLAENHYCPSSYGFEGPRTFSPCNKCVTCLAKKVTNRNDDGRKIQTGH